MLRLSQRFEFCASRRLYNPALTEEQNRTTFGKCSNPHGHGHNYEVQVMVKGRDNEAGGIMPLPKLEQIVQEVVIDQFDHENLNLEVSEFAKLLPSVENIAMVIYRMLKNRFAGIGAELASVTLWETTRTWCEYSE